VRKFNQALLGKWLWRYAHEERAWWRTVLVSMGLHGMAGVLVILLSHMGWGFGSIFVWGGTSSSVISDLTQGVGSRISFWKDVWCGESSLKDIFPGLFSIARFKEASIADNMERSNGTIQWNIVFIRLIHDWEVEILASFYNCLYSLKLRGVGEDKLWWIHSSKGAFEVRSYYRVLSSHGPTSFPWKGIWRTKAPPTA
jgi:hypothetical protein